VDSTVFPLSQAGQPIFKIFQPDIVQFDKHGTAREIAVMVSVNRYWLVDLTDGSVSRIWRRSLLRKIPYNSWGLAVVAPQYLSSAFGSLTADYVTTLYAVGGPYGNCTPCGTCPWDDRVVIIPGDDSGSDEDDSSSGSDAGSASGSGNGSSSGSGDSSASGSGDDSASGSGDASASGSGDASASGSGDASASGSGDASASGSADDSASGSSSASA